VENVRLSKWKPYTGPRKELLPTDLDYSNPEIRACLRRLYDYLLAEARTEEPTDAPLLAVNPHEATTPRAA
jgi:hypothetical protein